MYLRNFKNFDYDLNGKSVEYFLGKNPLYPTAFPWKNSIARGDGYGAVLPVALVGKATGVTTQQDCWAFNSVRATPTAGFTVAVSSANAADASAGTGCRTIEVDLIEATTYEAKTVSLTLNGQAKVTDTSGISAIRVNGIRCTSWGTGNANAGIIYAYDSTDTVTSGVPQTAAKIFGSVSVGDNVSKQALMTVPAGYMALNLNTRGGITDTTNTSRSAIVTFGRSIALNAGVPVWGNLEIGGAMSIGGPIFVDPEHNILIDEKQDIRIQVKCSGAADIVVYSDFILFPKV